MEKQNFIYKEPKQYRRHTRNLGSVFMVALRLLPYLAGVALLLVIIIFIFVGSSFLPHYASLKSVYAQGQEAQLHLKAAESFVREQSFGLAKQELKAAEKNFQTAQVSLAKVSKAAALRNKNFKNQYEVAEDLLIIGETMSGSMAKVAGVGEEVMNVLNLESLNFGQIDAQKKGEVLAILTSSMNDIKDVQRDFITIDSQLRELEKKQPMFVFNSVIKPLHENIPRLTKGFNSASSLLKVLPAFAGYPEQKIYLFILENNREMRPSGGFIGAYGILEIENAEIKQFFTDNSYNLDVLVEESQRIPSPEPMKLYMNQPNWYFRDANWWPDFKFSAERTEWFYKKEGGEADVDGVIAITPTVIEELLGVLGEFEVGGLTFNQENFWEQLQYQVEYGYYKQGIDMADRKDIIGDLGKQIISRLFKLPLAEWPELIDMVGQQAKEKHILLYFHDPVLQEQADENGWSGRVADFEGDYIMLVDANLAALKTDSVMDRTMIYNLTENEKGELIAEVKVNYQNNGTFSWKTTRYRTYTRLYVPAGSELISVKAGKEIFPADEIDEYDEFEKRAWGVFFEVEPKTSKEVVWQYKLPALAMVENYQLMVQKQPGIPKMNLQLNFDFEREIKKQKDLQYLVNDQKLKHSEVIRTDQIYNIWFE
jgi:hypothetical protein